MRFRRVRVCLRCAADCVPLNAPVHSDFSPFQSNLCGACGGFSDHDLNVLSRFSKHMTVCESDEVLCGV